MSKTAFPSLADSLAECLRIQNFQDLRVQDSQAQKEYPDLFSTEFFKKKVQSVTSDALKATPNNRQAVRMDCLTTFKKMRDWLEMELMHYFSLPVEEPTTLLKRMANDTRRQNIMRVQEQLAILKNAYFKIRDALG